MKNLKVMFALTMVLLLTGNVASAQTSIFPARGSAMVTGLNVERFNTGNLSTSHNEFYVTNITNSPVTVKMSFYDHDGTDITEMQNFCIVMTGSQETVAVGTGTFDIPSHSTRRIIYRYTSSQIGTHIGHTVIEWTSSDPRLRKALIALYRYSRVTNEHGRESAVLINGGNPF